MLLWTQTREGHLPISDRYSMG